MPKRQANATTRLALQAASAVLPEEKVVKLYRFFRRRKDLRRLSRADFVLASHAKSGRTWLRVMISKLFQLKYSLPENKIIELDNYRQLNPDIPAMFFTAGSYIRDIEVPGRRWAPWKGSSVIFLARHPCDVAVSRFFHVRHRAWSHKHAIKGHPDDMSGIGVYDFCASEAWGVPNIVTYLNEWAERLSYLDPHLLIRYEDMRADPQAILRKVAYFMGETFSDEQYDEAVNFASFESLKEKERSNYFKSNRLVPGDPENPDSYKVRRAKVGGYRDYFNDEQTAHLEKIVMDRLEPIFGYHETLPR